MLRYMTMEFAFDSLLQSSGRSTNDISHMGFILDLSYREAGPSLVFCAGLMLYFFLFSPSLDRPHCKTTV